MSIPEHIPPPEPRDLLPSLLACLSIASATKQPPEALVAQLSPILAQKLKMLATDNWVKLLSWNMHVASRLPEVVNAIHVEPHPVSGEIEIEDPIIIRYRRLDVETLHARIILPDLRLITTYLWCTGGEGGNGWKLAEVRGLMDEADGTQWFPSMSEANQALNRPNGAAVGKAAKPPVTVVSQPESAQQEDDGDDAYWNAYDRTPGRTPARTPLPKRSPGPGAYFHGDPGKAENDYFARYADEVQPALDAEDSHEEADIGESTLHGNALGLVREPPAGINGGSSDSLPGQEVIHQDSRVEGDQYTGANGHNGILQHSPRDDDQAMSGTDGALNHPRPTSPSATSSVERLEREAEQVSQTEHAIKQHISTDIKSLFRLARSAGIDREEFERIIKRELEVLPMLEQDD